MLLMCLPNTIKKLCRCFKCVIWRARTNGLGLCLLACLFSSPNKIIGLGLIQVLPSSTWSSLA